MFREDDASLIWLMIQGGMGILSGVLKCNMDQSFWRLKWGRAGVPLQSSFASSLEDLVSAITPQLMQIYEITLGSTVESNPYYVPLRILIGLLQMEKDGSCNLNSLLGFGPRVPPAYRILVRDKDERALLLLMLWLRLLCREDNWWVATRARNEYAAVSWLLCRSEDERISCIALHPDAIMR